MKCLFVVLRLHYLRNFEPVIRQLLAEGHEVVVGAQDGAELVRPELGVFVELLRRDHERFSLVSVPDRRGRHGLFCEQMRLLRDFTRFRRPGLEGAAKPAARVRARILPGLRPREAPAGRSRARAERRREGLLAVLEAITPIDPAIRRCLRRIAPDLLLVTPMVSLGSCQVDFVAAARDLGIPSVLGVASWDNLTNKGLVKALPDRVLVWNARQKAEAVELHGLPATRVAVTGAQLFDDWFGRGPSRDRAAFCARVRLDPSRPFILYLASSIFIRRNEVEFALRWLEQLATAPQSAVRRASVMIRPYPKGRKVTGQWADPRIGSRPNVVVYPPQGRLPLLEADKADYFDSLYHCAAVVGINTSGMIEAGILGRPCLTLLAPELAESQWGMPHFAHLVDEGFVTPSGAVQIHLRHLADALEPSQAVPCRADVEGFLRPQGLDRPATPLVARALTDLADSAGAMLAQRVARRIGRALAWPVIIAARLCFELRLAKRPDPRAWLRARAVALATYDTARWLGRQSARQR